MSLRPFSTKTFALLVMLFSIATTTFAGDKDAVMNALEQELQRTMQGLSNEDPAPYFLSYGVTEMSTTTIVARFGGVVRNNATTRRVLDVDLRVGGYGLDNTHSIRGVAFELGRGTRGVAMPMGDDVDALRTIIWRATDKAYRSAAERFEKVVTNMQVKVREEDSSADLSHEQAFEHYDDPITLEFDNAEWQERVRALSSVFAGHPAVFTGQVSLQADLVTKTMVNSEGTRIRLYEPIIKVFIIVKTKADDGMSLPLFKGYSAYSADRLPSYETMLADAKHLLELCLKLPDAPLMETYTGPAILSGSASGVFFHEIFGHRVEGHRLKDENSSQTFKNFVGKPILPDFINVIFDPTKRTLGGQDIVGAFKYDDEGMPGKRVVAVENGIFKNFLMSRSPIEGFEHSTGHGRRQAGFKPVARQSNLIVEATESVPLEQLREMLREECRKQDKEYGLLFENIQGGFTFTGRTIPNAFNVQPLVVYKIFADGRPDELVRGVDLIGTPLTTFDNITAAGDDLGIFNGVCGAESGGVPVSASSPSILVSTIEVQKKKKSQAKPPLLADPTADDGEAGTASAASPDVIFKAMFDEQQNSIRNLVIGDLPRPYHIEYVISKRHRVGAHAILGIVDDLDTARMATLTVRIRVGAPKFDNTNFFDVSLGFFGTSDDEEVFRNRTIPLNLSYDGLRRELWLATDACFKQALEIYSKKMATVKNRTRTDTTWDFFLMPGQQIEDVSSMRYSADPEAVVSLVEDVSELFRSAPHVQASRVGMEFVQRETFYLNSEGRQLHKVDVFSGFEVIAVTQAEDGMPLSETYAAYSINPADLPDRDSLRSAVGGLIAQLETMRSGATIEPYSGPVLFEGQAAGAILAQEFSPNLVSQRKPMSASGFSTGGRSMAFQNKIGARVLPEWLSVNAVPSKASYAGGPVAGHFRTDDEGIRTEDVLLVDKGYLRGLLSSRVPTRRVQATNGHQRGGGAMLSVIELTVDDQARVMGPDSMRARLLELVSDRDLEFGIIIRKVLDQNLFFTGLVPMLQGDIPMSSGQGSVQLLEIVRLFPDGHEEPLRGVEVAGFSTFLFKDIIAVGPTPTVHNYLARSVVPAFITGGSQFVISTMITPDLLFEDVEVKPRDGDLPTVPRLQSPLE